MNTPAMHAVISCHAPLLQGMPTREGLLAVANGHYGRGSTRYPDLRLLMPTGFHALFGECLLGS